MRTFILLCWRNIWRQKKRSLLVISSVVMGITAMLFSLALMNSLARQMVDNTISAVIGHIAIHKKGFHDSGKIELNFLNDKKIFSRLTESGIRFSPKIKIEGTINSSESSSGVLIVGIDPDKEKKVSKIHEYTSGDEGSSYITSASDTTILISKTMAKKLDLKTGDRLVMKLFSKDNVIEGVGMTVCGIFESPFDSLDRNVVFTGIEFLQKITGLENNISEITVLLDDKNRVDEVKKTITSFIGRSDLEILTWQEIRPDLIKAVDLFDQMTYLFSLIIFITVIFSVSNVLVMSIMERFHEIGVLKSIGTSPYLIFMMIMFEAINLCFIGLAAGLVLSLAAMSVFSITGINFSYFSESMRVFGSGSVMYPYLKPVNVVVSIVVVMAVTLLAAFYPAVKAARIKPLEALNFI